MNRFYLVTSYDPDDYPDYNYIMVGFNIDNETGFNAINGIETCHVLINEKTLNRYNDPKCFIKNNIGILANDLKYFDNVRAGMIIQFDLNGDELPMITVDWINKHKNITTIN